MFGCSRRLCSAVSLSLAVVGRRGESSLALSAFEACSVFHALITRPL